MGNQLKQEEDKLTFTETNYCSKCKAENAPLVKYAKNYSKNKVTQYHLCRKCNRLKQRKDYENNKQKRRLYNYANLNPYKQQARVTLKKAIDRGDIVRPELCQDCGTKGKLDGCHTDYSRALDVRWLCRPCHYRFDNK